MLLIKTPKIAPERAIHAVLRVRGRKIIGGGDEWFKATRDEIIAIYQFVIQLTPALVAAE